MDNCGFKQGLAHSGGAKHQELVKARFSSVQLHFKVSQTATASSSTTASCSSLEESPGSYTTKRKSSTATVSCLDKCTKNLVTQSELLWGMKVSHSNYSYRSCDDLPSLFKKMFPGNVVAENFTMSKSKVSYLISDGLGPYFRKDLCIQVSASPGYVIQYDETANSQVRKQCDILAKYWSEDKGQVVVHFLRAAMFGHATGDAVANSILETLQETGYQLPLGKLLNLGSDGPNVLEGVSWAVAIHSLQHACGSQLFPKRSESVRSGSRGLGH